MDEATEPDAPGGESGLLRRQVLKGGARALLAVGVAVLLTGCPSTSQTDPNNEPPDLPEHEENPDEPGGENPDQGGEPGGGEPGGGGGEPGGGEGGGGGGE
jgi:hypothetical protein